MNFLEKVILITGASSGIGEALALECARQGASVIVTGRRLDRLEAVAQAIRALGRPALAVAMDVTDPVSVSEGVAAAVSRFGKLDVVVANAGFGVNGPFEKLTLDDYRRQFETNVFGLLSTVKAGLPELKRSRGQLVLVGSVAGYISASGSTPYSMSKFAVRALAEGLRPELRQDGVALTLITPGFVESEIRKVDNRGQLHDSADPIPAFLRMPAAQAARKIAQAIYQRKAEEIITHHGKLLVFLANHCPRLMRWVAGKVKRGENKAYGGA